MEQMTPNQISMLLQLVQMNKLLIGATQTFHTDRWDQLDQVEKILDKLWRKSLGEKE